MKFRYGKPIVISHSCNEMNCLIGRFSCNDHKITIYVAFDVIVISMVWQCMTVISVTVNAFLFCHIIRTALLLEGATTVIQRLNILQKHKCFTPKIYCATPNLKTCLRAFPLTSSVLYVCACNTINHRYVFLNISHLLPQQ